MFLLLLTIEHFHVQSLERNAKKMNGDFVHAELRKKVLFAENNDGTAIGFLVLRMFSKKKFKSSCERNSRAVCFLSRESWKR